MTERWQGTSCPGRLGAAGRALETLFLAALLTAQWGCSEVTGATAETDSSIESAESVEIREDELPPVEAVSLGRGPIEAVLRFSTNLEAESKVQVFSQAARQVTSLLVEEGTSVRKGQVLLRLQDEEQRSELARTESQLKKARREYDRQQSLFEKELISEQAWNESVYEVEQLELQLEDARRNLSYTEVRAPISGTVTSRYINVGDQITINQHLFDLVDFDSIVARIYVPEKERPRLRLGQQARLFSDSLGGETKSGKVIRIAPIVDPKSGTVKVTVGIPRNQSLVPGMYVEVELVTETHEDALLIPKRAVIYDSEQAFLYRLRTDGAEGLTVEKLSVDVVLEDRENIEPRSDVLREGDLIVVAGQAGLKDGARVRRASGRSAVVPGPEAAEAAGPPGSSVGS